MTHTVIGKFLARGGQKYLATIYLLPQLRGHKLLAKPPYGGCLFGDYLRWLATNRQIVANCTRQETVWRVFFRS